MDVLRCLCCNSEDRHGRPEVLLLALVSYWRLNSWDRAPREHGKNDFWGLYHTEMCIIFPFRERFTVKKTLHVYHMVSGLNRIILMNHIEVYWNVTLYLFVLYNILCIALSERFTLPGKRNYNWFILDWTWIK